MCLSDQMTFGCASANETAIGKSGLLSIASMRMTAKRLLFDGGWTIRIRRTPFICERVEGKQRVGRGIFGENRWLEKHGTKVPEVSSYTRCVKIKLGFNKRGC